MSRLEITLNKQSVSKIQKFFQKNILIFVVIYLTTLSIYAYTHYLQNGLGLSYNDARSHLDIGRRVVEGLKPGLAQLGSVWLPLPHILMTLTIWNDFMWHTGLAGAIVSMISFVITGVLIFLFLKELNVGIFGRVVAVFVFSANINVLYLQSTAMTELLLLCTMTIAAYELLRWHKSDNTLFLIKSAFWIMLSTLVRYDGWFLLVWASLLIVVQTISKGSKQFKLLSKKISLKQKLTEIRTLYSKVEGTYILFATLAGFGILLWLFWNLIIFKDPLYFAFGPFSAKAQQDQLEAAGVLQTKHQLWLSIKFYWYALVYNSNAFAVILGFFGAVFLWFDKKLTKSTRLGTLTLIAPLLFNILALYMGHSVMFVQGLSGNSWFNVRYGIMLMPSIAIFIGYLVNKFKDLKWMIVGLYAAVTLFTFISRDAVTIDDARVGSSQKNVSEVSGWLKENAANEKGFVLISAASHDAIIFSSYMPMKRFIHEGTGLYWESATTIPDRWARWIIMRTYDDNDLTWKLVKDTNGFQRYNLVDHFPFADIYEIKPEYIGQLNTEDAIGKQR